MRLSVCALSTLLSTPAVLQSSSGCILKCNKWLLYWLTSGWDPAWWARFGETAIIIIIMIIMNNLTQFINQKGPRPCGSATTQLGLSLFSICLLFTQVSLYWWCLKVPDQVLISITNDPSCKNKNCTIPVWKAPFSCASLHREVRGLCRVQGSTGTSAAESVSRSRAFQQGKTAC